MFRCDNSVVVVVVVGMGSDFSSAAAAAPSPQGIVPRSTTTPVVRTAPADAVIIAVFRFWFWPGRSAPNSDLPPRTRIRVCIRVRVRIRVCIRIRVRVAAFAPVFASPGRRCTVTATPQHPDGGIVRIGVIVVAVIVSVVIVVIIDVVVMVLVLVRTFAAAVPVNNLLGGRQHFVANNFRVGVASVIRW